MLTGIAEAENVRRGLRSDPPRLIGDAEKAEAVMQGGTDRPLIGFDRASLQRSTPQKPLRRDRPGAPHERTAEGRTTGCADDQRRTEFTAWAKSPPRRRSDSRWGEAAIIELAEAGDARFIVKILASHVIRAEA